MVSENDILSEDVSSIASTADVLFPERPKVHISYYRHQFQTICIGASLQSNTEVTHFYYLCGHNSPLSSSAPLTTHAKDVF